MSGISIMLIGLEDEEAVTQKFDELFEGNESYLYLKRVHRGLRVNKSLDMISIFGGRMIIKEYETRYKVTTNSLVNFTPFGADYIEYGIAYFLFIKELEKKIYGADLYPVYKRSYYDIRILEELKQSHNVLLSTEGNLLLPDLNLVIRTSGFHIDFEMEYTRYYDGPSLYIRYDLETPLEDIIAEVRRKLPNFTVRSMFDTPIKFLNDHKLEFLLNGYGKANNQFKSEEELITFLETNYPSVDGYEALYSSILVDSDNHSKPENNVQITNNLLSLTYVRFNKGVLYYSAETQKLTYIDTEDLIKGA